jgi:hypothetical protein
LLIPLVDTPSDMSCYTPEPDDRSAALSPLPESQSMHREQPISPCSIYHLPSPISPRNRFQIFDIAHVTVLNQVDKKQQVKTKSILFKVLNWMTINLCRWLLSVLPRHTLHQSQWKT